MEMEQQRRQPHVLMVPFPTQGHITPMLNLAQLLCHAGIHITFLSTEHNHRRLTQRQTLSARFPTLRFDSIPDGLPLDDPRSVSGASLMELIYSLRSNTKPLFRDLLVSLMKKDHPLSCVLTDDLMSFAIDVAVGMGIPIMALRVISACGTWAYACIPDLIQHGHLPFADEDMDQSFKYIPGMEDLMRGRDLPTYFRMATNNPSFRIMADEAEALTRVSAVILNTFDDLEASMLTRIAARFPKIYPIGPLHGLLKYRVEDDKDLSSTSAVSMCQEDRRCMEWLDSQLSKSVVYVSFGSLAQLTRGDWLELVYGLVNSGKPFLMVVRKDMFLDEQGKNVIPEELELGIQERGFIVSWAPQEEVLAHEAVGGFMTQCGWNSTVEGIWAGVPMIGWPQLAEQAVTSRWVGEVWKIGIDLKEDKIDRFAVEKTVRGLMEDKREETRKSIGTFGTLARRAVSKGGSSYRNLDKLIADLRKL